MDGSTGIQTVSHLLKRTETVLQRMLEKSEGEKTKGLETSPLTRRFTQREAADLVGRDPVSLRRAEKEGKIREIPKDDETGRVLGYTLADIFALQDIFGTRPSRDKDQDECAITAVINFKGGVGKTETACNYSRYLASKGYRGLIIDMDSQASATSTFGFIPDVSFSDKDTVLPYLNGDEDTLEYAIQKTHWPNLDLLPSCMALHSAEFDLVLEASQLDTVSDRIEFYEELSRGIQTIKDQYDFIIIDSPPSLSVSSISILLAANSLVIPMSPAKHDLASTVQFFRLMHDVLSKIAPGKEYYFAKVLITRFISQGLNDKSFYQLMRKLMADACYEKVFRTMTAIKDASAQFATLYELPKVRKDIMAELAEVFEQIEIDMLRMWPSKKAVLESMGLVA